MNGSQKQIEWASKIQAEMIGKVEGIRSQFTADCAKNNVSQDDPQYANAIGIFDRAVANITAQTAATWFIDNRNAVVSRKWVKEMAA